MDHLSTRIHWLESNQSNSINAVTKPLKLIIPPPLQTTTRHRRSPDFESNSTTKDIDIACAFTVSDVATVLPVINIDTENTTRRQKNHACGLDCGHKAYKTIDGNRFVMTGAFPSIGDPCYNRYPKVKKRYELLSKKAKANERRRITELEKAYAFDTKYSQFTSMPPFAELELESHQNITKVLGDLNKKNKFKKDLTPIYDRAVMVGNDPLLKDYVGCNGFWPIHDTGQKTHFADAVSLSDLYKITRLPASNRECEVDIKMRAARNRLAKRKRNGLNTMDGKDLMLGTYIRYVLLVVVLMVLLMFFFLLI